MALALGCEFPILLFVRFSFWSFSHFNRAFGAFHYVFLLFFSFLAAPTRFYHEEVKRNTERERKRDGKKSKIWWYTYCLSLILLQEPLTAFFFYQGQNLHLFFSLYSILLLLFFSSPFHFFSCYAIHPLTAICHLYPHIFHTFPSDLI